MAVVLLMGLTAGGLGAAQGAVQRGFSTIRIRALGPGRVDVSVSGAGRARTLRGVADKVIRVRRGTRVVLVARTRTGAGFGAWGGACRRTGARTTCTLRVGSPTSAVARFTRSATHTTIACRAVVVYDGSPQAPCSAQVTGPKGFRLSLAVRYVGDHVHPGLVHVTAAFPGGATYLASSAAATFLIAKGSMPLNGRPSISNEPAHGVWRDTYIPRVATVGDGATSVTSVTPTVCSVASGVVTFVGVGTCSLIPHVGAGTDFGAADGDAQSFAVWPAPATGGSVPLIIDTDIYNSVDDVGALGTAFALQKQGHASVIATIVNTRLGRPTVALNSWQCAAAVAQYYRSAGTLLGADATTGINGPDPWINGPDPARNYDFIGPCAGMASGPIPTPLPAVEAYRQALASQANGTVVIASIGYFENLWALLQSGPDAISPLTGAQLVAEKVKMLVAQGGGYPTDPVAYTNFAGNVGAAYDVNDAFAHDPLLAGVNVIWNGHEVGFGALAGGGQPQSSPVGVAYTAFLGSSTKSYYVFDLAGVYYAVLGAAQSELTLSGPGMNTIYSAPTTVGSTMYAAGSNDFSTTTGGSQRYLVLGSASGLSSALNALLDAAP